MKISNTHELYYVVLFIEVGIFGFGNKRKKLYTADLFVESCNSQTHKYQKISGTLLGVKVRIYWRCVIVDT